MTNVYEREGKKKIREMNNTFELILVMKNRREPTGANQTTGGGVVVGSLEKNNAKIDRVRQLHVAGGTDYFRPSRALLGRMKVSIVDYIV